MRQKKLMLLGGIRYLLPVIEAAHEQGYYLIICLTILLIDIVMSMSMSAL